MPAQPELDHTQATESVADRFAHEAEARNAGLMSELWDLIVNNKKWWLIPTIVVLLVIGILVPLVSTAARPLIDTLL